MIDSLNTVKAITKNIESNLDNLGIDFIKKGYEDIKTVPSVQFPFGEIYYDGEDFEKSLSISPEYSNVRLIVKVYLYENNDELITDKKQEWVHNINNKLKIENINISELETTKLVTNVDITEISMKDYTSKIVSADFKVNIRYRVN